MMVGSEVVVVVVVVVGRHPARPRLLLFSIPATAMSPPNFPPQLV